MSLGGRLFFLALGKPESDFQPVKLIFFINVLDKGLEVGPGFIRRGRFLFTLSHTGSIITYRQVLSQAFDAHRRCRLK
jgi:hypothetical protein